MLSRNDTVRATHKRGPPLWPALPPNPGLTVTNNIVVINIINRITYDPYLSTGAFTIAFGSDRIPTDNSLRGGWGKTVVCGERAGFACARATTTLLTAVLLLQRNVFGVVVVGFAARASVCFYPVSAFDWDPVSYRANIRFWFTVVRFHRTETIL